jgi:hypothetical protein
MKPILINATKILLVAVLAGTVFTSCKKKTKEPASTRKTIVKILGGGTPANVIKMPVDFVPVPTQLLVVDLRRDPNDEAGLFSTLNTVVKDDEAAVLAANPNYIILPAAWYTIQSEVPKVGGAGGTWSFVFKPSEFAKEISITLLDPTLLDPSELYGLGFTITSVDASGMISHAKSVVIEIGAKNDWDGVYAVRGPLVDVVTPNLIQWANQPGYSDPWLDANPGAWEAHLVTASGTDCVVWDWTLWGWPAIPLFNTANSTNTGYGGAALVLTFNQATNAVASARNFYGDPSFGNFPTPLGNPASGSGPPLFQASNSRYVNLDPTGTNAVQGNRDILVKWRMYHPSVAPGVRTTADNHFEFLYAR